MLLALGVVLLVVAGVCYQVTGGDLWCHLALGAATLGCIAAFALAWRGSEA